MVPASLKAGIWMISFDTGGVPSRSVPFRGGLCFTPPVEGSDGAFSTRLCDWTGVPMPAALLAVGCAAASVAILAAKFFLAARINVNWDEFYFLSHVHDLARGELVLFLQGAYTHAFRWLALAGDDEMDQVLRGRLVMCALLAVAGVLTYVLARLW